MPEIRQVRENHRFADRQSGQADVQRPEQLGNDGRTEDHVRGPHSRVGHELGQELPEYLCVHR